MSGSFTNFFVNNNSANIFNRNMFRQSLNNPLQSGFLLSTKLSRSDVLEERINNLLNNPLWIKSLDEIPEDAIEELESGERIIDDTIVKEISKQPPFKDQKGGHKFILKSKVDKVMSDIEKINKDFMRKVRFDDNSTLALRKLKKKKKKKSN